MAAIDWSRFTWEAFATLVTGGAAVGAAWWVGRRQVGIADRQTRILDRQAGFEEMKLRTELFERRHAVYEATRQFLAAIMTTADEPKQPVQHDFLVAMDQARFLYRAEVYDQLQEIWKRACSFFAIKSTMKAQYESTGAYAQADVNGEYEALLWVNTKLETLSEVFGEELRLGATSSHPAA
jgi:hypothetical protein